MTAVSVVVTVRNEAGSIQALLERLEAQTRRPDEVVVVDGGSTDATRRIVIDFQAHAPEIRLVDAPGTSIAAGRNLGVAAAGHEIVAVTDAGTDPEPTWLERLVQPLETDPDLGVAGGFFVAGGTTWFERALATIITPQLREIDRDRFLPSSRSVAFRKAWWERVGGYPEWLRHCEDLVFDLDLRRAGAGFAFVPDAVVAWHARSNLRRFARQYFDYARGDGHAHLWAGRHAIRYSAYGTGLALLFASRSRSRLLPILGVGCALHLRKFVRRVVDRPPLPGAAGRALSLAVVPVVVVSGDLAKMVGYPVGLAERGLGVVSTARHQGPAQP